MIAVENVMSRMELVLGGMIPHFRFNTSIILLINVGLYLATAMYSSQVMGNSQAFMSLDPQTLFRFGASYYPAIQAAQAQHDAMARLSVWRAELVLPPLRAI